MTEQTVEIEGLGPVTIRVQPMNASTERLTALHSYAPIEVLEREAETGRPLAVRLVTGHIAYYQRRADDCMAAAVATVTQAPIGEVPDPRIDERLAAGDDPDVVNREAHAQLERWADERELRIVYHAEPPTDRGAWLGRSPDEGRFQGHVAVMCQRRLVFDPASNLPCPAGYRVAPVTEIAGGITFDRKEQ